MQKCERKSTEVLGDEREQVGITHHASHRADRVGKCRVILYDNQIFPVLPMNEGRELPRASPLSNPYDRYMEETACRKPQKAERRLYRASQSEFVQYFVVL